MLLLKFENDPAPLSDPLQYNATKVYILSLWEDLFPLSP